MAKTTTRRATAAAKPAVSTKPALTDAQVAERAAALDTARTALMTANDALTTARNNAAALPEVATEADRAEADRAVDAADLAVKDAQASLDKLTTAGETMPPAKPAADKTPKPPETLLGSNRLPAVIEIGPFKVQLGIIVSSAHLASGLTLEEWNALDEEDREQRLEDEIKTASVLAGVSTPQRQPEPPKHTAESGKTWVTVIGPVKGRRRAGFQFGPEQQSLQVTAEQLAQLQSDPALAVSVGVSVGTVAARIGRPMTIDDVDFDGRETLPVKVLGPTKGRRRAGFQFNGEAQTVEVDRVQLALILSDPELAVLPA